MTHSITLYTSIQTILVENDDELKAKRHEVTFCSHFGLTALEWMHLSCVFLMNDSHIIFYIPLVHIYGIRIQTIANIIGKYVV